MAPLLSSKPLLNTEPLTVKAPVEPILIKEDKPSELVMFKMFPGEVVDARSVKEVAPLVVGVIVMGAVEVVTPSLAVHSWV